LALRAANVAGPHDEAVVADFVKAVSGVEDDLAGGACGGDLGGLAAEAARAGLERGDEGAEQPRRAAAAPDVHHRRLRQLEPSRQPGHDCSVAVSPSFACNELVVAHRSLASWSLEVES
jgi:hypothetical protein